MVGVSNIDFDWVKEVKEVDESKMGVKGLVDEGVKEIPRLFVHPQEVIDRYPTAKGAVVELPVIDLTGEERGGPRRREVVEAIGKAAREWGFFSIINHGVQLETMKAMLESIKRFHELPNEEKESLYTYERSKLVKWNSNLPAQKGDPACWRKEMEEYVKYMIEVTLGGLQMLRDNQWVDVPPFPGALIANFGDLMQIISNDEFKELIIKDKPAVYRDFMFEEYFQYYKVKGARFESAFDYYRIHK
ncbi:hypothetical protein SASPL_137712 [Salvia splendens]|uniref:Non-haem dioxygenase N-terminal domain-containing protein n=1 Tax=Salvia splendens TaxID=180675 RepID=A0A8X8WTX5_SALSN|nr:hypothetical protein SASPL_137712 [Salvia splendens]